MRYIKSNRLTRILKRSEYLRVKQRGTSVAESGLVIQAAPVANSSSYLQPRVGFTVSKRVGNAVKRNKIKRRLRNILNEAVKKISINFNYSFLVIAKSSMLNNEYKLIKETLFQDFEKIK